MRLSASRSCLVAGAKPRRVLPRAGAITSRFESLEKLWRRRDERTSFGPSRLDSNPCFSHDHVFDNFFCRCASAASRSYATKTFGGKVPGSIFDMVGGAADPPAIPGVTR